ncbi:MAG: acetate--CoA ligase [Oligoflexia bacterium]|nr:acetate--CoA ligase [Oligoflexia bacterium]
MGRITTEGQYREHYDWSLNKNEEYWQNVAKELHWFKDFDSVQTGNFKDLNVKWFEGGQTNISYNCLDRHLKDRGDKVAVIYEANDPKVEAKKITYKELHQQVCQFANVLKDQGVKPGDRVCFYMGMVPELLTGILACTRIGAVHSVVFGGFSAKALAGRIQDCEASVLVTNDGSFRGGKTIALKAIANEALKDCPTIKKVLVSKRTNENIEADARDIDLDELLKNASSECEATPLDSEAPNFILYTSGSTGKPKGLLHTVAGYMTYAYHTFRNVFQMEENDIYWCSADIGWITGHTYLTYGPLLNGATTVMFEGVPTWPDAGRFWQVIDKLKVSHFYTAPTAIRALEACDIKFVQEANLSSLKVLGSVGEPINEEAWDWYHKNVGREKCPIVDTWWQTETGGIMISALAGVTKDIPTYATLPQPGIEPVLMDADGNEISTLAAQGNLCIKRPWPGIARTVYGDHERYKDTYFSAYPGYYFTGDGAKRDEQGNYRITGRVDDVINVSGHRIGTAEVEDAINQHPSVVESAVVGFPHNIKGQGIYAYVILSDEIAEDELKTQINNVVNEMIGPIAKPDAIQITPGLPKTRSGKIMRRILRKIAANELDNFGDTSTLLNPEIVDSLIKGKK